MAGLGEHGRLAPEQAERLDAMRAARGRLDGLYETLFLYPELADQVRAFGELMRFRGVLPGDVREAVILLVANETRSAYEWSKHEPPAREAGLPQPAIEALRAGRYDDAALTDLQRDVLQVVQAALRVESIPAEAQERVIGALGVEGLLEAIMLAGWYRAVAGLLVGVDVPLPADARDPWGPDPGPGVGGA